MNNRISRIARALAGAALVAMSAGAFAQAWPAKQPIKFVAVFPPGGSVDQVARILSVPLGQQLGQSIIVENKGGASGSIGTAAVAAAAPDGYTFGVVFDTHGVNPTLIPGMPFDTKKDLAPVALIGTSAMVLATFSGSEYKTFADVVAAAKAKTNVSYGSIGSGSLGPLAMALLSKSGNIDTEILLPACLESSHGHSLRVMSCSLGTLCVTLASLWRPDRDGLQGVFLQPIARLRAKKNNAADRPSPVDHRPQGVMQRVPNGGLCWITERPCPTSAALMSHNNRCFNLQEFQ